MLEIAGGIVLAIAILVLVLVNFGRIAVALSALLALAVAVTAVLTMVELPSEARNVILFVGAIIAAIAAFGYWTHHDKRFLLKDKRDD